MKIFIAAGGTGGHIYPGIAIAEEIKQRDDKSEIWFIGSRDGLEKELIEREGFRIRLIHARALLRKISFKSISAPFVTLLGFIESLYLLVSQRPDFLVVTGGYVSFPVIPAAILLKVPFLLHEQNTLPGMTNRIFSRFARHVALTFKETLGYIKGEVVGNPVRKKILSVKRIKGARRSVVVIGGSQGALSINKAIVSQMDKLKEFEVHHIIGRRDYRSVKDKTMKFVYPFYHPIEYMYNMERLYAVADLVVSRAGATAISEILAVGLPSILIPFPYSAEAHQDQNAKVLEEAGAACVLDDSGLSGLSDMITSILNDENKIKMMELAAVLLSKRDAAKKIVDLIYV